MNTDRYFFRGKGKNAGEWTYGYYCRHDFGAQFSGKRLIKEACTSHDIWGENGWVEIQEETLGQYTGFLDKNGQKIFEGDIVKISISPTSETAEANARNADLMGIDMPSWINGGDIIARISFFDGAYHFIHLRSYLPQCGKNVQEPMLSYLFHERYPDINQMYDQTIEVIGNIHDNPEILK